DRRCRARGWRVSIAPRTDLEEITASAASRFPEFTAVAPLTIGSGGTSNCAADRDISFSVSYRGVLKRGGMSLGKRSVLSKECAHSCRCWNTSGARFQIEVAIKKYYG